AVVATAGPAAAGGNLHRGFGSEFERGQRGVLADVFGDFLVERRRHAGTRRALIGAHAAEPGGWVDRVYRARTGGVCEMADGGHVLLVSFERLQDRAQLE